MQASNSLSMTSNPESLENGPVAEKAPGEAATCDGLDPEQKLVSGEEEARVKYKIDLKEVHVSLKRINVDEEVEQLRKKIRLGQF